VCLGKVGIVLVDGIGFFYPSSMSCRIGHIKPPCAYAVEGVERIWLLDFDDFAGYRFYEDGLYGVGYVEEILQLGPFREIDAPELVAKYSSTGAYVHRVETFVGALKGSTLSELNLARKRPQVVLFKTLSQQYFTFGYEAGASIAHTNQTNDGFGSSVTITANSIYPLFEYLGAVPTEEESGLRVLGEYPDDETASFDGVMIDEIYELAQDNIWGLPEGMLKRRKI
jgi:hypothetical protein